VNSGTKDSRQIEEKMRGGEEKAYAVSSKKNPKSKGHEKSKVSLAAQTGPNGLLIGLGEKRHQQMKPGGKPENDGTSSQKGQKGSAYKGKCSSRGN